MEWGRSCYDSRWHLFRDDPEKLTAGRYYVAFTGTPHLKSYHNLGSRRWHDSNWQHTVTLGEDLDCKQPYFTGGRPAIRPLNIISGSEDCLTNGEVIAAAYDQDELINGFPKTCFVNADPCVPGWLGVSAFNSCALQRFYARIIEWLYDHEEGLIAEAFHAFVGVDAIVKLHPAVGVFVAVVTVITNEFTICCLDGTRTFQQLALQAFDAIGAPTDFGIIGTSPIWYNSASRALQFLIDDGYDPGKPIFFAGHSYGGAVAHICIARLKWAGPNRDIRYLTFGAPKPGDDKLLSFTSQCPGLDLANDGDIVTVLPPDYLTLLPVMLALHMPAIEVFKYWKRPANQTLLAVNGTQTFNESPLLDSFTLLAMVLNAVAHIPQAPVFEHRIGEYQRRIMARCMQLEWPICQEVVDVLESDWGEVALGHRMPANFGRLVLRDHAKHTTVGPLILVSPKQPTSGIKLVLDGAKSIPTATAINLTARSETFGGGLQLEATSNVVTTIEGGGICNDAVEFQTDTTYATRVLVTPDQWLTLDPVDDPGPGTTMNLELYNIAGNGIVSVFQGDCGTLTDLDSFSTDGPHLFAQAFGGGSPLVMRLHNTSLSTPFTLVFRLSIPP